MKRDANASNARDPAMVSSANGVDVERSCSVYLWALEMIARQLCKRPSTGGVTTWHDAQRVVGIQVKLHAQQALVTFTAPTDHVQAAASDGARTASTGPVATVGVANNEAAPASAVLPTLDIAVGTADLDAQLNERV